ncbi:MAG: DUF4258 domain-containing protein [Pseudomonadota bacterium]
MDCKTIQFSRHAFERMFERAITPNKVEDILAGGEVIASYPHDTPYPSVLMLGFEEDLPIHIVAAKNDESGECYVITVYRPNPLSWSGDFKSRSSPR